MPAKRKMQRRPSARASPSAVLRRLNAASLISRKQIRSILSENIPPKSGNVQRDYASHACLEDDGGRRPGNPHDGDVE
jgi:hypothetical protein